MQRTRAAIKREQRTDLCQEPPARTAEGWNSIDLTRIAQRLCEDCCGAILTHKQFVRRLIDRTAAIDQVWSQLPEIARVADRGPHPRLRHSVGGIGWWRRSLDQQLDLGDRKPGKVQAEIEIGRGEVAQSRAEKRGVPPR